MNNKPNTNNLHFMQDYEIATIHRSKIKEAAYNPRAIDDLAFKDLKKSMKKIKLREPLVWNKSSNNLVGGHQRLKILDAEWKRKYKNLDYTLTVVVVDIDFKQEIELNIALNNPRMQGYYDVDKMNEILSTDIYPDLDFDIACIKDEDLDMFGIELDIASLEMEGVNETIAQFDHVKEQQKQDIDPAEQAIKTAAVKASKSATKKNEVDTYFTITFSNQQAKRDFMKKIGEPENTAFIKGEGFVKKWFNGK